MFINVYLISELKQEIQSKERKLNPDMNESQAAAAVRRCSSFRAAVDNRLNSSAENPPKSHAKSNYTENEDVKIILINLLIIMFRSKWIWCVPSIASQIFKSW